MPTVTVTSENVRRANDRVSGRDTSEKKRVTFVPSYKLPEFKYDSERVRESWAKVLRDRKQAAV
ncbi:hypothetical protein [Halodesulfovibrio spirochaetisodalis]|uniref:hypothetical protein n=1 Tax=Halodesulfovibrio spirochaetisodalis TaxID=1560234 RepID=UPI000A600EC7|nr:hypothetical protein [Halodesulfovibrio spirochaetisodalis]